MVRPSIEKMIERRFGRIVNITLAGVKLGGYRPMLRASVGVRAGLNGFIGVLARQVAHYHVTINAA